VKEGERRSSPWYGDPVKKSQPGWLLVANTANMITRLDEGQEPLALLLVGLCLGYTTRSALIGVTGREGGAFQITSLTVAANLAIFGGAWIAFGALMLGVELTRRVLMPSNLTAAAGASAAASSKSHHSFKSALVSACWIVSPLAVAVAVSLFCLRSPIYAVPFMHVVAVANVAVASVFWFITAVEFSGLTGLRMDGPITDIADAMRSSGILSAAALVPLFIEVLWHGAIPLLGYVLLYSMGGPVDWSAAVGNFIMACGWWAVALSCLSSVIGNLCLPYFLPRLAFAGLSFLFLAPYPLILLVLVVAIAEQCFFHYDALPATAEGSGVLLSVCCEGNGHVRQLEQLLECLPNRFSETGTRRTVVIVTECSRSGMPANRLLQEVLAGRIAQQFNLILMEVPGISLTSGVGQCAPLSIAWRTLEVALMLPYHYARIRLAMKEGRVGAVINLYQPAMAVIGHMIPSTLKVALFCVANQFSFSWSSILSSRATWTTKFAFIALNTVQGSGRWKRVAISPKQAVAEAPAKGVDCSTPELLRIPPMISGVAVRRHDPTEPLILCYFLTAYHLNEVEATARAFPDVSFHVFCSHGRPGCGHPPSNVSYHRPCLELFCRMQEAATAVISSSGFQLCVETVSSGARLLAVPTPGHLEQMLNAELFAASFHSVRQANCVSVMNVAWLLSKDADRAAEEIKEAATLQAFIREGGSIISRTLGIPVEDKLFKYLSPNKFSVDAPSP
jgi:hypothetical protein